MDADQFRAGPDDDRPGPGACSTMAWFEKQRARRVMHAKFAPFYSEQDWSTLMFGSTVLSTPMRPECCPDRASTHFPCAGAVNENRFAR